MENLNTSPKFEALYNKVYSAPGIVPEITTPIVIPAMKATSNNNNLIIGVCLILVIIGGVAIYYHFQSQKREEKILDQY